MRYASLAAVAAVAALIPRISARADFVPVSAIRSLSLEDNIFNQSTAFESFNQGASASDVKVSVTIGQNSFIGDTPAEQYLTYAGSFQTTQLQSGSTAEYIDVDNLFKLVFQLTTPMQMFQTFSTAQTPLGSVALSSSGQATLDLLSNGPGIIDLAAGMYTLTIEIATTVSNQGGLSSSINGYASFTVPAPGTAMLASGGLFLRRRRHPDITTKQVCRGRLRPPGVLAPAPANH